MASNGKRSGVYAKVHQVSVQGVDSSTSLDAKRKKSHRALYLMTAGIVCGVAFALGHHFMYHNLKGKAVDDARLSQAWNLRFGNLLAFLVKLSFVVTVGVAFVQLQWLRLRQQPLSFKDIDALSGIQGNFLSFFEGSVWFRFPALTGLAIVCWTLPLIPVITPGTLTVVPSSWLNSTTLQVPQLDTVNYNPWAAQMEYDLGVDASPLVSQLSLTTAVGGMVLPIESTHSNESYRLEFPGPAVRCEDAEPDLILNISNIYGQYSAMIDGGVWRYYSWVAGDDIYAYRTFNATTDMGITPIPSMLDTSSKDSSKLYIMTNSGDRSRTVPGTQGQKMILNVTECSLYNATYTVDFSFQSNKQNVTIVNVAYQNGISWVSDAVDPYWLEHERLTVPQAKSYCAVMASLGSLLVGSGQPMHDGNLSTTFTKMDLLNFKFMEPAVVQRGVESLFQNMTLSLFSNDIFLKNSSTADWIPVNITDYRTLYTYDSFALFLTYGLGLLFTLLCATIGFYAFFVNHGSYQNIFSTFLRATISSELQVLIDKDDSGADPRPKALARAMINIARRYTSEEVELQPAVTGHLVARKPVPLSRPLTLPPQLPVTPSIQDRGQSRSDQSTIDIIGHENQGLARSAVSSMSGHQESLHTSQHFIASVDPVSRPITPPT